MGIIVEGWARVPLDLAYGALWLGGYGNIKDETDDQVCGPMLFIIVIFLP